jgi:hypothetical protein
MRTASLKATAAPALLIGALAVVGATRNRPPPIDSDSTLGHTALPLVSGARDFAETQQSATFGMRAAGRS